MAIGQLFDYAYFGFSAEERRTLRLAVLLPAAPSQELAGLLASLAIGAAWPEHEGFREAIPAR